MSDAEKEVLCLRTCNADMTSYGDFRWPGEGETVEAPDWHPGSHCGNGLHGLLWGEGDGHLLLHDQDAVWMVFEADAASVVDLGGKVKVPKATVLKTGDREAVTAWLAERAPGRAIVGASATAGDAGTATAGYAGTATAGYYGTGILRRWNGKRYSWVLGEIGETLDESGQPLAPDVAYRLNGDGEFRRVAPVLTHKQESGGE